MLEAIDTLARIIGYGTMAFGVIWMIDRHNREKRDFEAQQEALKARSEYELRLMREDPEAYRQYREAREKERWDEIKRAGDR